MEVVFNLSRTGVCFQYCTMCKLCARTPLCLVWCLIGLPLSPPKFQSQVSPFGTEKNYWHIENPANDLSGQTGRDAGQTDPPFSQVSFPKSLRKSVWKKNCTHAIISHRKMHYKKKIIFCLSYFVFDANLSLSAKWNPSCCVDTDTFRDFREQPRNSTFEGIREIENVTLGW